MGDVVVNFTDWGRLVTAAWAIALVLAALPLFFVPVLALGWLWRRLRRRQRLAAMGTVIALCCILTTAATIFVRLPTTVHQHHLNPDSPVTFYERMGITGWYAHTTFQHMPSVQAPRQAASGIESTEINVMGVVAMLPALVMLIAGGRWIARRAAKRYRLPHGQCDACGYNITSIPTLKCPECGEVAQ